MDLINRFFRIILLALATLAVPITLTNAASKPPIEVSSVRLGIHEDKTRFVMELSEKPDYNLFLLPDPYRIVIDMPELSWHEEEIKERSKGIIDNFRFGLFRHDTSRVVLDVDGPVKILRTVILPPTSGKPHRFFIDIQKTDHASFMQDVQALREKRVEATPVALRIPVPPVREKRYKVVIDAGHGGIDPGAIGRSGVYEKTLVLQVARKLYKILDENKKFNPVLTRDRDIFLSLRERVDVARKENADLFISIHADSISRPSFRGATVYTLSETASDDEAAEIAKSENSSDLIAGVDLAAQDDTVKGILVDLAQRETMNFSVRFAEMLIPQMTKSGLKTSGRSHRFAGFRVLKAPDVPSVLVELGYLSNRQDEEVLKSGSGQTRLAKSIANAVEEYFKTVDP